MWYCARIIMKCTLGDSQKTDTFFEEQIRIIEAKSREEAYQKTIELGAWKTQDYKSDEGNFVSWNFEGIVDLDTISELRDGAEISSKRFKADSSANFVTPKARLPIFFMENLEKKANNTQLAA